jgi:hypothetical protein
MMSTAMSPYGHRYNDTTQFYSSVTNHLVDNRDVMNNSMFEVPMIMGKLVGDGSA